MASFVCGVLVGVAVTYFYLQIWCDDTDYLDLLESDSKDDESYNEK